jgi:hypothetical protein
VKGIEEVVPSYFHDGSAPALGKQVGWIQKKFDFDDSFVSALFASSKDDFENWKRGRPSRPLPVSTVREFCELFLHLLDLMDFDITRAKEFVDVEIPSSPVPPPYSFRLYPQVPPWAGTSLRHFLERYPERLVIADAWFSSIGSVD